MNGKKWTAAVLAAGMFFTTNFMTMGVAEMAEQREAVKVVQTAGRDRLGDYRSVEAMAVVITRHLCLSRKRDYGKSLDLQALKETTDSGSPEQLLIGRETEGRLLELIDSLPDRQQAILRMKHVDGMETDEIAALTS